MTNSVRRICRPFDMIDGNTAKGSYVDASTLMYCVSKHTFRLIVYGMRRGSGKGSSWC